MKTVRLGDVTEVVSGGTPKTSVSEYWGGEIPWATPKDLSEQKAQYISSTSRTITQAGLDRSSAVLLPRKSVLLSSRAPIGLVAINTVDMATNQGFKSLVPDSSKLDYRYLYHWMKANVERMVSLGVGATFKEISKKVVSNVEIPLPSLAEQRRIAGVLSRVNALHGKVAETLNSYSMLETSKSALLIESCATSVKIGDFIESSQYGTSKKSENVGPTPVLRMGNITDDGNVSVADLKYTDIQDEEAGKYTLREGDLLFNRTNSVEKVGKAAVVHGLDGYAYAGYLIRIRFKEGLHPEYVSAFLRSPRGVATRKSLAKTAVNQANINAKEFAGIEIPFPSSAEQEALVRTISYVRSQQKKMVGVLNQLEELRSALQYRAFRGEL